MENKSKAAILIKAMLIQSFRLNHFTRAKGGGEAKNIVFAAVILIAALSIIATLVIYYVAVGSVLNAIGRMDALLSTAAMSAMLVTLFFSIYKCPGYLYSFRDFDLLMSMPAKESDILISKIFMLYTSNTIVSMVMVIPALIIYGVYEKTTIFFYVAGCIMTIFIPVISIVIGALISFVIVKLSSKSKKSNILIIILSFVAMSMAIVLNSALSSVSEEEVSSAILAADKFIGYYYPARIFADALMIGGSSSVISFILFILINTLVFIVFVTLFAKRFKSVNALLNEHHASSNYKMSSLSVSSPLMALYKKEIRYYLSVPVYIVNTAFGVVLMTVYVIMMLLFDYETVMQMMAIPAAAEYAAPISGVIICGCIAWTCTTAPSISLEGNSFWILKTIPVRFEDVVLSKVLLNLTVTVPFIVINSVLLTIAFSLAPLECVMCILPALAYAVFIPLMGFIMNLFYPKLNWKVPANAVKQSASVLFSMLLGAVAVAVPVVIFVITKPEVYEFFILMTVFAILLAAYALWIFIKTRGIKIYNQLNN